MGTLSGCIHHKVNYSIVLKNFLYKFWLQILICHRCQQHRLFTSGASWAANISANFRKNSKLSYWELWGWGKPDSWKNLKSKISCTALLTFYLIVFIAVAYSAVTPLGCLSDIWTRERPFRLQQAYGSVNTSPHSRADSFTFSFL